MRNGVSPRDPVAPDPIKALRACSQPPQVRYIHRCSSSVMLLIFYFSIYLSLIDHLCCTVETRNGDTLNVKSALIESRVFCLSAFSSEDCSDPKLTEKTFSLHQEADRPCFQQHVNAVHAYFKCIFICTKNVDLHNGKTLLPSSCWGSRARPTRTITAPEFQPS